MGDTLHELNRKELKELCSRNNIRTAGVKHEDLVRLLRNKLSPSTPQTPRTMKTRGAKVHSPEKDDGVSFKTPGKAAGIVRNLRSATLPREDAATSQRKNSGLSQKPLMTKSNTISSRRTTNLPTKSPGGVVDQDPVQQSFVRRLCQINGLSPASRKGQQPQLGTASKASRLSVATATGKAEKTSSRASEGNASVAVEVEPSEAGSDASRRVSEIATDAGPDTLSDFSDADELRSVSSEPIAKRSSASRRNSLRTLEPSKMSQSGLASSLAAWDSSSNDDKLVADGQSSVRREASEVIFPVFPEDSSFLVGDTDALDLSFLRAGAADPEVVIAGDDREEQPFDVMESPMARDYVTYKRGGDSEACAEASRLSVGELASGRSESPEDFDVDTSFSTPTSAAKKHRDPSAASSPADKYRDSSAPSPPADKHRDSSAPSPPADKQRDSGASPAAEDAESKPEAHVDDLAGNEGPGLELSCSGVVHSYHGEPVPTEDVEVGPEIHSELSCLESNSPTFDSKDYRVAKKLLFEPEESIPPVALLQQPEGDDVSSSSRSCEGEAVVSVAKAAENQELSSSHSKSFSPPAALPQENELSLTRVAPEGVDDEATSTVENHVSQPDLDSSYVFVHAASGLTSDATEEEEVDGSNTLVDEQAGVDVKVRDGECASSSAAVLGYNKDEREKEKLSLPLSIILWCSQLCSIISRNRTPRLGS